MIATLDASLSGVRDRALLLVDFAGAFRRSELVALEVRDLSFGARGVEVTIRRTKTDQEGAGRVVALPLGSQAEACPVRAIQARLVAAGVGEGPIFPRRQPMGRARWSTATCALRSVGATTQRRGCCEG